MDGEAFLRRLQAGDDRVWDDIMPMVTKLVFGACYRIGIRDERREDILQDVMIKLITKWQQYEATSKLSTWIYRIARNACIDELRKQGHVEIDSGPTRGPGGDDGPDVLDTLPGRLACTPLQRLCVEAVLDELERQPPARDGSMRMIDVIRYCVEQGPSGEELAEFMKTTPGAARERKRYIWRRLRELCEKHCGHPECAMDESGASNDD